MLTEEEAKTKWCPFARCNGETEDHYPISNRGDVMMPRNDTFAEGFRCLASECMAWRSTDNKTFPCAPGDEPRPSEPAGYCGLAGKP